MSAVDRSIVDVLRGRAARQGDAHAHTFLVDGEAEGAALTYAELDRRSRAIATSLATRGIAPGERALLLFPPGLDFIVGFFGCLYARVVAVPCYPPHAAQVSRAIPRLASIVDDAEAAVVLTTNAVAALTTVVGAQIPRLAAVPWISIDDLDDAAAAEWRDDLAPESREVAFLQYTSGSTAAPKGVMVTHANLMHNLAYANHVEENDLQSVSVSWLPVYHDMGLIEGVLEPVFAGYPAYLMAPAAFLQRPARWLQAISRYRATNSGGPNFAYDLCVRKIPPELRASLDLRSWRVAYNGAEPIRGETLRAFHRSFESSGFQWSAFYPVYGLAEATLVVSSGRRAYEPVERLLDAGALTEHRVADWYSRSGVLPRSTVASGPTSFGVRVVIVDPKTCVECPPDRIGEIWVSSPSVARGYWRRPDETCRTFGACLAAGTGPFLRTGDLGFVSDGNLFVTGRLKDLMIVRGLKHYPQDLEHTAECAAGAIRAGCTAAFTVEQDGMEHVVLAAEVDPRFCRDGDMNGVIAAIKRSIAEQHGIQVHVIVLLRLGGVPKTSSGKLRRRACRDAFLTGTLDELARSGVSVAA